MPLRFVGIGVNQYPNHKLGSGRENWDLDYAAHDCLALADELYECRLLSEKYILADGYASVRPWRGAIWRLVRNLSRGTDPILFYFAGHGTAINGELRICPGDFDNDIADKTSIPISEIIQEMHAKAPWLLFVVDCCRAPIAQSPAETPFELSGTIRIADNVMVMFACSHGQHSLEAPVIEESYGGVFSHFLTRSFRKSFKRQRPPSAQSVAKIFERARDWTSSFAIEEAELRQTPSMLGAQGADFYFSRQEEGPPPMGNMRGHP